jgi:hypothetical protein
MSSRLTRRLLQQIPLEAGWDSSCHRFLRIRARRCVYIIHLLASMLTWNKILVLAIISTAVIPITFLVLEAPPTPPCACFCRHLMSRLKYNFSLSIFWLAHIIAIYSVALTGCDRPKNCSGGTHDLAREIRFRDSRLRVLSARRGVSCPIFFLLISFLLTMLPLASTDSPS